MKTATKLKLALLLGLASPGPALASEAEQITKIASLPIERCRKDLTKLRDIHGQLRFMTEAQGEEYLALIGQELKKQGIQMPPPPAPCSGVHLALEQRCGDVASARNSCSVAAAESK